jgi:hypothetical protein
MTNTGAYINAATQGRPIFMAAALGDGKTITTGFVQSMALVDGSGNQITSFGGGTQYASGVTQATPTGTVALGINASNVLNALLLDASGYLEVNVKAENLTQIGGSNLALGQTTMSASIPVVLASNQASIPVTANIPIALGLTDASSTITAGGTAQQLMAANASRHGWSLYNSSAAILWINDVGGNATSGGSSFGIAAGVLYETPPNGGATLGAISIYGGTTGQVFAARQW